MSHIKNIEIKNFKSIRHQKIEGCKRINVFIGYPNVGKSNILEALSLYGVINIDNPVIPNVLRLESNPNIFYNGNVENVINVTLNGVVQLIARYLQDGKVLVNCSEIAELNKTDNSIFRFTINKDYSISELVSILGHNPSQETSFVPNIVKYNFKKEALGEQGADNLMGLNSPSGKNLYSLMQYNSELKNEVKELLQEYSLSLIFDQGSQMMKVVKKVSDENAFIVSFDLLADTLLRFIFYKAAILSNKEKVLLFEEPEAHMFPPYIKKFTVEVIFDKTNQFFITTHSPYVLDDLIAEAGNDLSVYLVNYKDGETKVHYLKEEDLSEIREYGVDLFFNIENYLKHGQINCEIH